MTSPLATVPAWSLTLVVLVVLVAVNGAIQPHFFSSSVFQSNLTTFLPLALVAIGQTYVILAGDIDLSVGAIVALVNVTTVTVITATGHGTGAILAGLAVGLVVGIGSGLANGILIAAFRLPPIVTIFATTIIFAALALRILPQAGLPVPDAYWQTYGGSLIGAPVVMLILLLGFAFILITERYPFHLHLMAVGGNREGAFQSGLGLSSIRIAAYALNGLFAAIAALCLTGETASGDPLLGQNLGLGSISAVVLGGTALSGGKGGGIGSILGALVLGMIGNVIFFAGLPFQYQTLVQGLIVLAALAGGVLVAQR